MFPVFRYIHTKTKKYLKWKLQILPVKSKKSCPATAMQAPREIGDIAPTHSWPRQLVEVSGQLHAPVAVYPRERTPCAHWVGGWVGPRAGLDTEARGKILCLCRGSNPGRTVCSQTLYWLRFPAPVDCIGFYRVITNQAEPPLNESLWVKINTATWYSRHWYSN
jgi:hypothetical protein